MKLRKTKMISKVWLVAGLLMGCCLLTDSQVINDEFCNWAETALGTISRQLPVKIAGEYHHCLEIKNKHDLVLSLATAGSVVAVVMQPILAPLLVTIYFSAAIYYLGPTTKFMTENDCLIKVIPEGVFEDSYNQVMSTDDRLADFTDVNPLQNLTVPLYQGNLFYRFSENLFFPSHGKYYNSTGAVIYQGRFKSGLPELCRYLDY